MDEPGSGQCTLKLGSKLVDVDVAGAVAAAQRPAPGEAVELLARDDAPGVARERHEQVELADRERQRPTAGENETFARPDLEIADPDQFPMPCLHGVPQVGGAVAGDRYPGVKSS